MAASTRWTNWARNQSCRPAEICRPDSLEALRRRVGEARAAGRKLRLAGAGHSWSPLACTDGCLISLSRLDRVVEIDAAARTATVEAGMSMGRLVEALDEQGLALPTIGGMLRQSVGGTIATATHGTGAAYGNLATAVTRLESLTPAGELRSWTADASGFHGAVVSLGALGPVVRLTLQCEPAFGVRSEEYPLPIEGLVRHLDQYLAENDYFQFFDLVHTERAYLFCMNRDAAGMAAKSRWRRLREWVAAGMETLSSSAAMWLTDKLPLAIPLSQKVALVTLLSGKTRLGRSFEVLSHENIGFRYRELEVAIPRERAAEAVRAVRKMVKDQGLRVDMPITYRFVKADGLWLSPAYGRDTCYVSFATARRDPAFVESFFDEAERLMRRFDGRPHWGKCFSSKREYFQRAYPKWQDFDALRARLDPERAYANDMIDALFPPGDSHR
jgi:FAD-linked oxidoreductase